MSLKKYTIRAGQHSSGFHISRIIPITWSYVRKRKLYVWGRFSRGSRYDLGDNDQKDWNKLGGINLQVWKESNQNSAMVAWRYNPDTELYEINAYGNVGGANVYPPGVMLAIPENTMFMAEFSFPARNEVQVQLYSDQVDDWKEEGSFGWTYPVEIKAAAMIGPWFGGNRVAPEDVSLEVDCDWRKK